MKFGLRIWVEPTYNVQDSAEPHYRQLLHTRGKICVAGSLVWSVQYCTVRADKSQKISGEMWDKFFTIRQYNNFYVHHPEGGEREK